MTDHTPMGRVRICFAPPDAKLTSVFALLLEQHGLQSDSVRSDAPDSQSEEARPTLVALSSEARRNASFQERCRTLRDQRQPLYVLRFDDVLAADLPDGLERAPVYEFSAEGLRALLEALGAQPSEAPKVREIVNAAGDERPDWSLQRFRYGLWVAFSRATGSGKFDPYPLTHSKHIGAKEALLPEVSRYAFRDPSSGSPVAAADALSESLDRVWDDPDNMIPNAVHMVEATAERLWNRYQPQALDQLRTA